MSSHSERLDNEGMTVHFKVTIPGVRDMIFMSCQGIESEVEVASIHEGGSLAPPHTVRGSQMVNKISFSHGIVSNKGSSKTTILDWYDEVRDSSKALEKKVVSIKMFDEQDNQMASWELRKAWPCRWVGPLMSMSQNDYACEFLSFAHEGIEVK